MSELLLNSLEIKDYRCFEHLTIEKLGRVNLIVGKNNVGKTSFLETIRIYIQQGRISLLRKILESRNEIPNFRNDYEDLTEYFLNFFPHNKFNGKNIITIEKSSKDKKRLKIQILNREQISQNENLYSNLLERPAFRDADINFLVVSTGNDLIYSTPLLSDRVRGLSFSISERRNEIPTTNLQFVQANGLDESEIVELWDKIVLTPFEEFTIEALKIISPTIQRISFRGEERRGRRIPIVKTVDYERPFAIRSLGEGMNRLLGLTLSLVTSTNGVLVVDEIESGLHYSVLPDVWRLIFKTARDLNVQVFATTHSKDCIEAFAQAASESPEDGMLIRLERQGERIVAKTIEEEMLVDAVDYEVEVR